MMELMQKEYKQVQSLCMQARDEMLIGYKYFFNAFDYTGAYVFYCEVDAVSRFCSKLDRVYTEISRQIVVPCTYDCGLPGPSFWNIDKKPYIDANYLNALKNHNCQEIRFKNGSFYGYYCYNIYSKIYSWILELQRKSPMQAAPIYECAINYIRSRMAFFMKFEG